MNGKEIIQQVTSFYDKDLKSLSNFMTKLIIL